MLVDSNSNLFNYSLLYSNPNKSYARTIKIMGSKKEKKDHGETCYFFKSIFFININISGITKEAVIGVNFGVYFLFFIYFML